MQQNNIGKWKRSPFRHHQHSKTNVYRGHSWHVGYNKRRLEIDKWIKWEQFDTFLMLSMDMIHAIRSELFVTNHTEVISYHMVTHIGDTSMTEIDISFSHERQWMGSYHLRCQKYISVYAVRFQFHENYPQYIRTTTICAVIAYGPDFFREYYGSLYQADNQRI